METPPGVEKFQPGYPNAPRPQKREKNSPIVGQTNEIQEASEVPTPIRTLDNMSKHLTKAEIAEREAAEAQQMPARKLKKPKLITQDKAALKHWNRIVRDMQGLDILDVLDTDALAIYCAKLARRDDLQAQYLAWRDRYDEDPVNATLKVMIGLSDSLQSVEREVLSYANKLGLTPESRARLAKRLAEQDEDDPDGDLFA